MQGRLMSMTTNRADVELWLSTIRTEGSRLASMPADQLGASIPSLADWTVERVVRHVGRVHRWVTNLLAAPADADPAEASKAAASLPRGPDCLAVYRDSLDEMVAALSGDDPERPVASFVGQSNVAFWLRRQTHEIAVHRIDAADAVHAAGGPTPDQLDRYAAADGVGEWIEVFAATRYAQKGGQVDPLLAGRTIGFVATDIEDETTNRWALHFEHSQPTWEARRESDAHVSAARDADATITAPSEPLLLALWRRRPLDVTTISGDVDVAAKLIDTFRF